MHLTRHFTREGQSPYADVTFVSKSSRMTKLDGSVVFSMDDVIVPSTWDQTATDVLAQKYFRRKGCDHSHQNSLYRSSYARHIWSSPLITAPARTHETDLRETIHRIVGALTAAGERLGYFEKESAQVFYDELSYMLATQRFAPNSPQWFNTGLHFAYGITGDAQGHYHVDPLPSAIHMQFPEAKVNPVLRRSTNAYEHPQTSACQPYHALVATPSGPRKIGDIVTQNMVGLQVFDREGTTEVLAVKSNGVKPVLRAVTKSGHTIEATADHQILVKADRHGSATWATMGSLKPGQCLVYRSTTTLEDKEVSEVEIAEAFLAGWLQGDGHVGIVTLPRGTSLVIEAMTADADEHNAVMQAIAQVFPGADPNIISVETVSSDIDLKRIRFYGKDLCTPFVEKYGLLERRQAMHVPEAVLAGGRRTVVAYLRALFQADGYVASRVTEDLNTHLVALDTISKDLMGEVHTLLANLGIFSRIKLKKEPREDRQDHYCVSIQVKSERQKFAELVGFVSERKQTKLLATLAPDIPGRYVEDEKALQVERIEYLGDQPVYDIQTRSENYLCGNIVVHNCFIQSVSDDLVNEGGIMDLAIREARLFKYGSGSGTNFSNIRGANEPLSGGGVSSGLMSFLKVGDAAGGAIKSGGTSRRAAKMVILDADHPDIEAFVNWKVSEEHKVAMLAAGSKLLAETWKAMVEAKDAPDTIKKLTRKALKVGVPGPFLDQCLKRLELGDFGPVHTYDLNWDGEGYGTVSSQNANNSVRFTDAFMEALDANKPWALTSRIGGKVIKEIQARDLWKQVARAAWMCADPGIQFHDSYNNWHTGRASGEIRGTNPCSEYAYLDDTACNLASVNLGAFFHPSTGFDLQAYRHANYLITIALEITVAMSQYPSADLAQNSYDHRTLGLGYANLGALLMHMGLPYDSPQGRAMAAALTAIMTGVGYTASAHMAAEFGPFPAYEKNAQHVIRVIQNHAVAAGVQHIQTFLGLNPKVKIEKLDPNVEMPTRGLAEIYDALLREAQSCWFQANEQACQHGVRNAQISVLAPTGTIGLVMGCDTTGVEPDFALVKFKKLAGGGHMKLVNSGVPDALTNLGYSESQIEDIVDYVLGEPIMKGHTAGITKNELIQAGFTQSSLEHWDSQFRTAFDPSYVISEEAMAALVARFGQDRVDAFLLDVGGRATVEGAPHLKPEHLPIFDCANRCGKYGTRYIHAMGHLKMMAATQPFISGSISKTVNLPAEATIEEFEDCYYKAWRMGIKAVALYRDGSKMSQPLATNLDLLEGADTLMDEEVPTPTKVEVVAEALTRHALRRKLPSRRGGYTQAVKIADTKVYLRTGEYEDGTLGEIFLDTYKEGAAFKAILNSFAVAVSIGLQYGVPLEEFCDAFLFTKFEPNGPVRDHDVVKMCLSLPDFIFRDLAITYLHRYELAHVSPEDLISEAGPRKPMSGMVSHSQTFGVNPNEVVSSMDLQSALAGEPAPAKKPDARGDAIRKGYTGDPCPSCGHLTMVRSGTCARCTTCGGTSGCS